MRNQFLTIAIWGALCIVALSSISCRTDEVRFSDPILLHDDGGWCWFQDPRVVANGNYIVIGSVANGRFDTLKAGNVDAIVYDIQKDTAGVMTLHERLEANDHATPAFLVRSDQRWLALYSEHNNENRFYYRISEPEDPTNWGEIRTYSPSEESMITYSNLYSLEDENNRIYNFFRGLDRSFKPSWVWSDDLGKTWHTGSVFIDVAEEFRHRPYVKYRSDDVETIHMVYTQGHPRNYDNSVFHIYYRDGWLHQSDGSPVTSLSDGLNEPEMGSLVFQGDADNVAWVIDMVLDKQGQPRIVFSVKTGSSEASEEEDGMDHRYYYGLWNGKEWDIYEMAYAGTRLYKGENEYTGLAAIDPANPEVVYISTDSEPSTGKPLISETTGNRQYELFRGETPDGGITWEWTAITSDSEFDNLRPMVADGLKEETFLVWLRGEYRSYIDYDQDVMGMWIRY